LFSCTSGISHLLVHSRSVVHGDLSSLRGLIRVDIVHTYTSNIQANVPIRANGRAYIADLGLSRLLTALGGSTFATSYQAKGILRWAAPELFHLNVQVSGDEDNPPRIPPTPRSDIYSFGGIMLQVLTGKIPYHYYPRDGRILFALSQGETPKRPSGALVTDRQWTSIERCWMSVESRPSDDEVVGFTKNELVQVVLPQG
ncbi:hypothetical protein PAXINDRAFT_85306, partial [Paxillus involutus ATCC 200175]